MEPATGPAAAELTRLRRLEPSLAALQGALRQATRQGQGDIPPAVRPAFGLLVVRTSRERSLLVGEESFHHGPLPVLGWRTSPLARIFLTHQPGEDYELELEGRILEGLVVARWLLVFEAGRLARVETGRCTLISDGLGSWTTRPVPANAPTPARPASRTHRGLALPDALLDPEQRAVLDTPADATLLVEGAAGSGKTTACLRRMVRLAQARDTATEPMDVSVVTPEEGLAQLCKRALNDQGAPPLSVLSFRAWLLDRGQRCFPTLPTALCPDTPFRVRRFFRHPALLQSLPPWIAERSHSLAEQVDHDLFARGALLRLWEATDDDTPLQRLQATERAWCARRPARERHRIQGAFGRARRALRDPRPNWEALWQDRRLLERAVALSEGELGEQDLQAVLDHAWLQFSERSEQAWAHVDPERLRTIDGLGLDEGTPHEAAGTLDLEAYAVLLACHLLEHGMPKPGSSPLPIPDHLMVDEVQERAPVELRVLAALRSPTGSLTMSGDRAQRMDTSGGLPAHEELARTLQAPALRHIVLRHAHRGTRSIARFCHALLGPLASVELAPSEHDGPPVRVSMHSSPGAALAVMADALGAALAGGAEIAVIAHDAARAREIHGVLAELSHAVLVLEGHFDPRHRGLTVTTVDQVGGLEFGTVWVPDADSSCYPLRDGARRRLYVACSRARHVLWVLCPGTPSAILGLSAPAG